MATYLILTRDGDLVTLDTPSIAKSLDPKSGLIAKRFVPVKDLTGQESLIPIESVRRISKAAGPVPGLPTVST